MKAYTIKVTGRRIKLAMPINNPYHLDDNLEYDVCSECSAIIKHDWDHNDTCSLYENETLAAWVHKGIMEQT